MSIDDLVAELRAAVPDNSPEVERLAEVLRVLQVDDSSAAIADWDRIIRTLLHPALPLLDRVHAAIALMQERLQ